jgi:hypothetical protein
MGEQRERRRVVRGLTLRPRSPDIVRVMGLAAQAQFAERAGDDGGARPAESAYGNRRIPSLSGGGPPRLRVRVPPSQRYLRRKPTLLHTRVRLAQPVRAGMLRRGTSRRGASSTWPALTAQPSLWRHSQRSRYSSRSHSPLLPVSRHLRSTDGGTQSACVTQKPRHSAPAHID